MSRSVRLETRSRARDELRRAMTSIDKVKKWEKKWVSVGSNACSLRVYKWVPRDASKDTKKPTPVKESPKPATIETPAPPAPVVPSIQEDNSVSSDSVEKPEEKNLKFPAAQFLPAVNETNDDSRDSFTASSAEFMKYCPDPDSQDSLTCSDYTVATMSDQLEDSTKPNSKCSTPPHTEKNSGDPKITVADAFKNKPEPTAPSLPEPVPESEGAEQLTELKEQPKPQPEPVVMSTVTPSDVTPSDVIPRDVTPAGETTEEVVMQNTGEAVEGVEVEGPPAKKIKEDTSET